MALDANQKDAERGARLATARDEAGLTQREAARRIGTSHTSLSSWENGAPISEAKLDALVALYGKPKAWLRYGEGDPSQMMIAEPASDYAPNAALRKRLRPAPYARVFEHIEQLSSAGASIEQIEEAERLMIDAAYNKLNARDLRDRTDADMMMDIDDAWDWIREVLSRSGIAL